MSTLPTQVKNSSGRLLRVGKQLGKGGEGAVHEAVNENDVAIKIYWPNKAAERRDKIAAMVSAGWFKSSSFVAFPIDVLYAANGTFVGFLMKKVGGQKPIHLLYSPASRKREFAIANFRFLVRTALNIARAVATVHSTGCVIGDINHSGFLVSDKATVTLIDSDSFQVTAANRNFLCTVGTPEYTPPEIQGKRFDHTSRSPNQDNFGLAVLIFQLLFMGRHPFSGRYLGKGDMPLERAIADFRFAYSSRQTETQMAPPPRVPLLTDFPQYVAEGFEAAFGRATFSRRPTAANWVSLIQKLEGELQQCPATTAHHHVKGKRCPFCYMEQATPGFLAFVSGTQNPLPLHVDIKSLIAQLNSIADPGVPPSLQSVVSSPRDLRPSAAATDVIFLVKRHLWIALATSISAVFLMQFGPPMTILGLFLSCAGLIVSFKPPAGLARIGSARTQAENAWRTVQEAWSRQESNKRFIELKTEAQTVVRLLQELPQEEQRGLQHLERKKRENQLRRHLEKFNIASARIRKIGSGRKVVLASHGIETAADIDEHHLQSVPGFGPTLTSELLTWRRTLEGRFAFNPREPLNPADISMLRGALAKRKVEAENRLRGAVLNLQNTAAYARDLRSSLSRSAQHAFTQLQQAKLDERKGAGHFYKPVKAIAVICAAVGIFTSGMLSQGPTTRQLQKAEVANKSPSSSQGQQPTSSPPRSADVPTNKFASPTERVLPTTPQPTKPEARLPKPEKPGDPPAVADNGFRTPGGIGGPLIPVPVPQVPKPGISGERSLPPAATSPPTKPEARTPGGIGGPLVPVPFPNPHTGSVAPPPLGPPKEIGKPPAAISQVAE